MTRQQQEMASTREVDLRQLAVDRGDATSSGRPIGPRRHWLSRYVLPGVLLIGLLGLVAWAVRDLVLPRRAVTVVPVLTSRAEVQQEGTPLFKAAGWIEPRPTPVRVAALAPGVVERLLVVEDQPVKAGEPIAELVKDDAQLARRRAEADRTLREAELEAARATLQSATIRYEQPVHLEAILGGAEAELAKVETELAGIPFEIRRAEAQLAYAQRNFEGKTSTGGAVAGRAVDEARSHYESAQAFVEEHRQRTAALDKEKVALKRRCDALRKQLELRADERQAKEEAQANLQAASARLRQAEVDLAEAELRLKRMTVTSPVDGRVLHLVAPPGGRLVSGTGFEDSHDASTVVTLYQPDRLQVRVDVRFEDLPRVQVGQPVAIASPAIAAPVTGRVLFVSSEADIQKNTLEVKVSIDAPPAVFKPAMLVDVTFLAPKTQDTDAVASDRLRLLVPGKLIERDETGSFVWIADRSAGIARRTPVEVGPLETNGLVEVTKGIDIASRIIATGRAGLRDGQRVHVAGEAGDLPAFSDRSQ